MIVMLALLSALAYGAGVAFEVRAATEVSAAHAGRPSILIRLVRRPLWVSGLVLNVVGFALQAAALRHGSLVVVQPLLTTSLLFTLLIIAAWTRSPINREQWTAILLVVLGLSIFLGVAMKASDVPAATPSNAARAVPLDRNPIARPRAMIVTTAAVHSSQLDVSAVAAPVSPGDATPRKIDRPSTTRRIAVHCSRLIGLRVHAAMISSVKSSDVVSSGCTTTSDPWRRAAACRAKPTMFSTRPVTQSGRRTSRSRMLGRPAWAAETSVAARTSNATPAP